MSLLKLTLPSYLVKVEVQMSSNVFIAAPVGLKGLEFYTESTGPKPVDDRSSGLVPFFSIELNWIELNGLFVKYIKIHEIYNPIVQQHIKY